MVKFGGTGVGFGAGGIGDEAPGAVKRTLAAVGTFVWNRHLMGCYLTVVSGDVTLNVGLDAEDVINKLKERFPGWVFEATFKGRGICVKAGGIGDEDCGAVKTALEAVGTLCIEDLCVMEEGVQLNSHLSAVVEIEALERRFPGFVFKSTLEGRGICVEAGGIGDEVPGDVRKAMWDATCASPTPNAADPKVETGPYQARSYAATGEYVYDTEAETSSKNTVAKAAAELVLRDATKAAAQCGESCQEIIGQKRSRDQKGRSETEV
ncbi:hypothetical protein M885DRAFT_501268 [Pelagophyceae sp. CCMP2097]|nr:hypothetical protein M885DRAFT_501268 [Pelagophyceae sp. CCMP2097]